MRREAKAGADSNRAPVIEREKAPGDDDEGGGGDHRECHVAAAFYTARAQIMHRSS